MNLQSLMIDVGVVLSYQLDDAPPPLELPPPDELEKLEELLDE